MSINSTLRRLEARLRKKQKKEAKRKALATKRARIQAIRNQLSKY